MVNLVPNDTVGAVASNGSSRAPELTCVVARMFLGAELAKRSIKEQCVQKETDRRTPDY